MSLVHKNGCSIIVFRGKCGSEVTWGRSALILLHLWQASLIDFSPYFLWGWQRLKILLKRALQAELIEEVTRIGYFRLKKKCKKLLGERSSLIFLNWGRAHLQSILRMALRDSVSMKRKCVRSASILPSPWGSSWWLQMALMFSLPLLMIPGICANRLVSS